MVALSLAFVQIYVRNKWIHCIHKIQSSKLLTLLGDVRDS